MVRSKEEIRLYKYIWKQEWKKNNPELYEEYKKRERDRINKKNNIKLLLKIKDAYNYYLSNYIEINETMNLFYIEFDNIYGDCKDIKSILKRKSKRKYYKNHPDKIKVEKYIYNQRLRLKALKYYSNRELPECKICGENHLQHLEIHHKDGGGNRHRRTFKGSIYQELKNKNYPEGFEIICSSCNVKIEKMNTKINVFFGNNNKKKNYRYWIKLRLKVLSEYKTDELIQCVCCGETDIDILEMDHKNDDGKEHRDKVGGSGGKSQRIYRDIIKKGYPDDYRILCRNCNHTRGTWGYCPHDNENKIEVRKQTQIQNSRRLEYEREFYKSKNLNILF